MLGEGDGRGLAHMLKICPQARFDVVELSANMIGLANRRARGSPRVSFHQRDVMEMSWPPHTYDAVVTHFFLDCLTEAEVQTLIARLKPALRTKGMWLIGDFTIPRRGWRHWWAALWVAAMYRFFRVTTGLRARKLAPFEQMLHRAGLRETCRQTRFAGMVVSALWVPP